MANHTVKFISFDKTTRIGTWTHPAVIEIDSIRLNVQVTLSYVPNYKQKASNSASKLITIRVKFENGTVKKHPDYKSIRKQTQDMFMKLWKCTEIYFGD